MKKKIKVWTAVAVAAVIIAACSVTRFGKKEVQDAASPPVVTVTNPEIRTIELTSELIGTVEPDNMVYVTPRAGGEVTGVSIKAGDRVQAGDLLCTIDTKQVESARLAMEAARVSMNTAEDSLNRLQILYAGGDISEQEFTQAGNSAKAARIQFESAQEAYRIQTENANITAPISGMIESCGVELHDNVGTGDQICVISGDGGKAVTFYVSDRISRGIRQGDSLTVEKNGSTYPSSVTEVSTMVDASTGLFKVKAAVEDQGALPTGSSVKLTVVSERADQVLTIPVDAVYYEQGNPIVYTYVDGTVHKVPVETGLYDSEYMEIKGGLSTEDQVIKSWTSELYEGSKVELAGNVGGAGETAAAGAQAGETTAGAQAEETAAVGAQAGETAAVGPQAGETTAGAQTGETAAAKPQAGETAAIEPQAGETSVSAPESEAGEAAASATAPKPEAGKQ